MATAARSTRKKSKIKPAKTAVAHPVVERVLTRDLMPPRSRRSSSKEPPVSPKELPESPNEFRRNPYPERGGFILRLRMPFLIEQLRTYMFTALWLLIVMQFFFGLVLLLPLTLLGPWGKKLYIRLSMLWDGFSQGAILCVPFSWCSFRVYTPSWDVCIESKKQSSLWMSNHSSRVDWLVGLYLGYVTGPRVHVRFIAEATIALMPIAGWARYLIGDVYLRRTFHRDAVSVREKLAEYRSVPASRMLFFAPEGAIADVGNVKDTEYVVMCEDFMTDLGRPKMRFLLTPRYKGLSVLRAHAPEMICSVTMAFITSDAPFGMDIQFAADGAVHGGSLCTLPLRDPNRVVPDIHTVFGGGLHVFTHVIHMTLPDETLPTDTDARAVNTVARSDVAVKADPPPPQPSHELRDVLLDDYARKDRALAEMARSRKFPGITSPQDWTCLPCPHLSMNAVVLAYAVIGVKSVSFLYGLDLYGAARLIATVWASFVVLHALGHAIGSAASGHSRESLVGESAIKAVLEWYKGGLDHGHQREGAKKTPKKETPKTK